MLKIAGVLLILTGCTGVGLYTAMRYLIRIHLLEEIEQAMQFIYSEIEYAACDMVEIMHMLAARSNACRMFWCRMEEALLSCEGKLFYQNWKEHITGIEGYSCLKTEEKANTGKKERSVGSLELRQVFLFRFYLCRKRKAYRKMTINLIFKIAAVGILVSVLGQVLKHSGRDEQAFLVSLAGLIMVLLWVIPYILDLFRTIQSLFEL